jgi:hypothetical protein
MKSEKTEMKKGKKGRPYAAPFLMWIIGVLTMIVGVLTLFIGILVTLGVRILDAVLPHSVSAYIFPDTLSFIGALIIVLGISAIVVSRLFHLSGRWLKENQMKGAVLGMALCVSALMILFVFGTSFFSTFISYLLYIGISLYTALLLLIILSLNGLESGLNGLSYGLTAFFVGGIIIIVSFLVVYMMFPSQLSSAYSLGSSSVFSVLSIQNHLNKFSSSSLNYSYPASMTSINLNSVASFVSSYIGVGNKINNSNTSRSSFTNMTITVLLPYQFILSAIGDAPSMVNSVKSFNLSSTASEYLKQNNSEAARKYLESEFPPLKDLSLIVVGSQLLNTSHSNLSLFKLSPSAFQRYLSGLNVTGINRTFPINITGYMLSQMKKNTVNNSSLAAVLPSEILLVNISNHVGFQLSYSNNKIFNLTRIPFSGFSAAFYIQNYTLCFEVGAVFPSRMTGSFYTSFFDVEKSMRCSDHS